jgi:hypothetical protein
VREHKPLKFWGKIEGREPDRPDPGSVIMTIIRGGWEEIGQTGALRASVPKPKLCFSCEVQKQRIISWNFIPLLGE